MEDVDSIDINNSGKDLLNDIDDDKIMAAVDLGEFCDKYEDAVVQWIRSQGYVIEEDD